MNMILQLPLSDEEVRFMRKLGIPLWLNRYTEQIYLHRGAWEKLGEQQRYMVTRILEVTRANPRDIEIPKLPLEEGNQSHE